MQLFHGSQIIIEKPLYGAGKCTNDYGSGFYCTQNIELAKEWSCTEENNGYANEYEFDLNGLTVLNLCENCSILNWLAILLENRIFEIRREIAVEGKKYLLNNFLPEYKEFDVIKGYRADDSYFSFANAFLNNTISVQKLNKSMKLGKLGEQIVLKSEKSFEHISFVKSYEAQKDVYFPKKAERDSAAREDFRKLVSSTTGNINDLRDEIFLLDLIRQEVKADDARLQRALSL